MLYWQPDMSPTRPLQQFMSRANHAFRVEITLCFGSLPGLLQEDQLSCFAWARRGFQGTGLLVPKLEQSWSAHAHPTLFKLAQLPDLKPDFP